MSYFHCDGFSLSISTARIAVTCHEPPPGLLTIPHPSPPHMPHRGFSRRHHLVQHLDDLALDLAIPAASLACQAAVLGRPNLVVPQRLR